MDNPNLKWMMTGFGLFHGQSQPKMDDDWVGLFHGQSQSKMDDDWVGLFHGQSQSKMDDDWVWSISWTIPI